MIKYQRSDAAHHVQTVIDRIEIDFADKSDLTKTITMGYAGQSMVSVHIQTIGCTGMAGNWVLKQDVNETGSTSTDLPEGSLSQAAVVTGVLVFSKGTLTMEFLEVELPATLPSVGKAIITITAKAA